MLPKALGGEALAVPNVTLNEKTAKEKEKTDWWTGTSYKGVQYLPLSSSPDKFAKKGSKMPLRYLKILGMHIKSHTVDGKWVRAVLRG